LIAGRGRRAFEQPVAGPAVLQGLVGEAADHREAAEAGQAAREAASPLARAEEKARETDGRRLG
jgi:hypothetical protein